MRRWGIVIGSVLAGLSLWGCERIPDWEKKADKTRSLELATRLVELRKWVFSCRGQLSKSEKESDIALSRMLDVEVEAVQDYFRAKNLSSIDSSETKTLLGTAFLWDSQGHALMALQSSGSVPREIECRRGDGGWYKAQLLGVDSSIDYGVLKIEGFAIQKQENPWLTRSSSLKEDEAFYAVSVPLSGFVQRLPVSLQAIGYNFNSGLDSDLLTFLPALSPLFLGGFIVDEKMSIVGFALPQWAGWTLALTVERMRQSVTSIIRGEILQRPFLGLRVAPESMGFVVQQVEVGGPAYRAGLRPQDILTHWDGRSLSGISDWREMTSKDIGRVVTLKYRRGDSSVESSLRVGAQD